MIDYETNYCRIYELNRNLNAENVEDLTLEDLQMLALMQKDRIESLLSERYALRSELKLLKKRDLDSQGEAYTIRPVSNTKVENNGFFFGDPARQLSHDAKIQDLSQVENPDNFFYNKRVVISGIFESYPMREDLALILKKLGADVNTSISKKTDVVIFGNAYGPSKMKKVKELNESGCSIAILNEKELSEKFLIKSK